MTLRLFSTMMILALAVVSLIRAELGGLTEEELELIKQLREKNGAEDQQPTISTDSTGIRIRVGRDQTTTFERLRKETASVFTNKAAIEELQKDLDTKVVEKVALMTTGAITAAVNTSITTVTPLFDQVNSRINTLQQAVQDSLDANDEAVNDLKDDVNNALSSAIENVDKKLEESATQTNKSMEALKRSTDKSVEEIIKAKGLVPTDSDQKACNGGAVGQLRFYKNISVQICDGKKWALVSGDESTMGEEYAPFGSRTQPWGKTCIDIQVKRKALGENPKSGVYWINGVSDPGPIRVYCDMDTDGGGWTLLFTWTHQDDNGRHTFQGPIRNRWHEVLDPTQAPIQSAGGATIMPSLQGLNWMQRRSLWGTSNTKREYRWDAYRGDGGLQLAVKGTNTHSSNVLWQYVRGARHSEIGTGWSNARLNSNVEVIAKRYADNVNVGQSISVYSHGHYNCDCSEGYYLNGHWCDNNAWMLFGDIANNGCYGGRGGSINSANHAGHAAAWMR